MTSLADATAAGAAAPTDEVTAVRPDGVAVTLPASSVPRALELGYRIEDAAGTAARLRHEEYGTVGKELGSAALGAARGLTFGLSDVALRKSGALTPEQLRAYQEESPTASTLGEYAGIAAGVLTPGAIGRVLGTGVRGAAAVGDLAAGALNAGTRALGVTGRAGATGIALDALAGGAAGVARGAAEGAVYGAGQGISNLAARDESELGHPAELAQVLVAHAGMGALLGGAIGGTVGGTTSLGLSATRRVLRRLGAPGEGASLAAAAAVGAPGEAAPATAPIDVPADLTQMRPVPSGKPVAEPPGDAQPAARTAADKLRDTVLRYTGAPAAAVTSLTSGVDQDFLSKLAAPGEAGKRLRKVAFEGDDIVSEQTRALTKTVTGLEDDAHVVMNATLGEPKATTMGNAMRRDRLPAQLAGAMEQVNRAQALIDQARDPQYAGAIEGSLKRFEKSVLAARVKLIRLGEAGENAADAGREAYTAIDTLKKAMGHVAKPGGQLRSDELAVAKLFQTDYNDGIQEFLENTDIWGEAGNIQKTHNGFWKRLLNKKKVFDNTFMTELGRHEDENFWTTRRVADPARVHSFLADAGHVRADLKSSVALDQVQALANFARSARDNFELSAKAHAAAERIIAQAPVARATIRQAIDDAGTRNLAKQLTGTVSGKAFALMTRIDSTVGIGEPVRAELRAELRRAAARIGQGEARPEQAAALLEAVQDIRTEQQRQAELGAVGRTVRGTIRAFSAAVDRSVAITERAERIATPIAVGEGKRWALSLPAGDTGDDDDNAKGPAAEVKRRLRALHRFTGDPLRLYQTVHDSTRGMAAVAPQTAAEAAALAARAVGYLGSVAPRQPAPGLYAAADGTWAPNTAQAVAFDAALRAVMQPLSVADDLADGSLTRPGVQALKAVYPGLHDMIAAMLAVRLQRANNVPLQRRLQLSALFDLPTDGATAPDFAAMIQQGYALPSAEPRPAGGRPYTQADRAAMRRNVATATQRLG